VAQIDAQDQVDISDHRVFTERSADPSSEANKGKLYTKDVSGTTELFYLDSTGATSQLTSGGVAPTQYWQRSGTILSPLTSGDTVEVGDGGSSDLGIGFVSENTGWYLPSAALLRLQVNGFVVADYTSTVFKVEAPNLRIRDGAAATPSFSFTSDPNTGLYSNGADNLGVSVGGSPRMLVTTTHVNVLGAGSAASPSLVIGNDVDTGLFRAGTNILGFTTAGVEGMRIDASGNLVLNSNNISGLDITQGSVLFSGASGLISQDNTNLFWDDTSNLLGVGTATPTGARVHGLSTTGGIAAVRAEGNDNSRQLQLKHSGNTDVFSLGLDAAGTLIGQLTAGQAFRITDTLNMMLGSGAPDATAKLEISSTTQGFLPPRMTTTQRDAITTPAEGLVIYNTTTQVLNFYNGTTWGAV